MPAKKSYRVLRGLNYPPQRRAEAGDVVDDLPEKSIPWLLEQGCIEEAPASAPSVPAADEPQPNE